MPRCTNNPVFQRFYGNAHAVDYIRNIGIIAHIDAGKTTTSERMLFYSGYIRRIGEVDRGDTVLDYLPEERERGITITAAAITFPWQGHRINLIDTPGHVDFGMEVERSLRVMDGAITILDGRAGVQAQTRTVWRQANKFKVPRIVYVNKLDKVGADFHKTIEDIKNKLEEPKPICVQSPIVSNGRVEAIADLIDKKLLVWSDDQGKTITRQSWEGSLGKDLEVRRLEMLEHLAGLDDEFLEKYLDNPDSLSSDCIDLVVRKLTLQNKIAPAFGGSSSTNVGVQPLLDAVIRYLPGPCDHSFANLKTKDGTVINSMANQLLMLAFKVAFDMQRGLMVFVRVYSGILSPQTTLRNTTKGIKERPTKLMMSYADKFEEMEKVLPGNIAVLLGLKNTTTGDTLVADHDAKQGYLVQLEGIPALQPVFTCSVEAESNSEESKLEESLRMIELEDPSLKTSRDMETGQRHISGMGELQLEIVGKRITKDFKVKAILGDVRIAYKETILLPSPVTIEETMDKNIDRKRTGGGLRLEISSQSEIGGSEISFKSYPTIMGLKETIHDGIQSALQVGPQASFPVIGLAVSINEVKWIDELSTIEALGCLAHSMVTKWLSMQKSSLVEPIVGVEMTIETTYLGIVLNDIISMRRGLIISTNNLLQRDSIVQAEIPLSSILGYASHLRSKTSGSGSFSINLLTHRLMSKEEEQRLLAKLGLINE